MRISNLKMRGRAPVILAATLIGAAASADTVVFFDFTNSGLNAAQQTAIMNAVKVKYTFTTNGVNVGTNLMFTTTNPGGNPHRIVFNNQLIAADFGDNVGNKATVYRKKLTNGHWRNVFNTAAKQQNAMVDTAAHELGHQFLPGGGHNNNAPNAATPATDVNGDMYKRTPGNGTLVNGRPGLMANGEMVVPAEHAADLKEFTQKEKNQVANAIKAEKAGRSNKTGGSGKQTDLQFVQGVRFDPENPASTPQFLPPFPLDRMCRLVDADVVLEGNASWDFGFVTTDGGFVSVVDAGQLSGEVGFEPGDIVDFAIRQIGAPANTRLAMSQVGQIVALMGPIPSGESVSPPLAHDYFQQVVIGFDVNGSPTSLEVLATLQMFPVRPNDGVHAGFAICRADLDGDGQVGASDLAILLGSWGAFGLAPPDLDGDGVVGAGDLAALLGNWGPCL